MALNPDETPVTIASLLADGIIAPDRSTTRYWVIFGIVVLIACAGLVWHSQHNRYTGGPA